jgi:hypothetical protein
MILVALSLSLASTLAGRDEGEGSQAARLSRLGALANWVGALEGQFYRDLRDMELYEEGLMA